MAHRTLWVIVGLVLVIAVGVGGFFLGMRYESAQAAAAAADRAAFLQQRLGAQGQGGGFFGGAAGGNFGGGTGPGAGNFGGARGTIKSVNGDTVIVNGPQGPVTVHLSAEARIFKSVEGSRDDLKTGESVTITGQRNPDGSINATAVILQPRLER